MWQYSLRNPLYYSIDYVNNDDGNPPGEFRFVVPVVVPRTGRSGNPCPFYVFFALPFSNPVSRSFLLPGNPHKHWVSGFFMSKTSVALSVCKLVFVGLLAFEGGRIGRPNCKQQYACI